MRTSRTPQTEATKPNPSPPITSFLPAAIILMILGWSGLAATVVYTSPSGGTRWAFFFCAVLGVTGVALPAAAFLNRRFPSTPAATPGIVLRQALWVGVYFPTLAWLQIGRVLTPFMALLLGVGFVFIEGLLRMRERSLWDPSREQ